MELQISVDRDTKGQNVRRNKVIFCDTKVSELSVGHHLSISGALSAAKPPGKIASRRLFPYWESSTVLRDDSLRKHQCFGSLSVGIAVLNRRLNLDYPLTGK